ncbi:unnamed protein product [Adineta steineri]|uniref:Uncharacterized protein n=1 Tax=Adineta steineri TaxID=433720 RepID=A0A819NA81_9BILA|nr:unnamed protein product [Adineta steineri]CAF3995435.1 unnamed protein product [Adineta steineri]
MHLFDKLRASLRRKPNKIELTLSEQIENLFNQSYRLVNDHRLQLLRLVYERRLQQFHALNVPVNDSKRLEFERSILNSLLAITSNLPPKSHSVFRRSSTFYKSMPLATSVHISKNKNLWQ